MADDMLHLNPQQVAETVAEYVAGMFPDVEPRDEFHLALLHATLDTAAELCRDERQAAVS